MGRKRKGKKIVGYNIGSQKIRVYESGKEAAESLGLLPQNINANLKNRYEGVLEGWVFYYYDEFFETDLYKKSTPDGARKEGMLILERFREAREVKGKFCSRERLDLLDYVNNYLRELILFYERELIEYEIKIAKTNYDVVLLQAEMYSNNVKLEYYDNDADTFKRLADILSDPVEANWYKEKYINSAELYRHTQERNEVLFKEITELMDYEEKIRNEYGDMNNKKEELENVYHEFVEILREENIQYRLKLVDL